jgi:membrane dipeptidase
LEIFEGPVWASHSNCRALVDHNRQFADEHFRRLIERGAVIGGALDAWMMVPGWVRGTTTPESSGVKLSHLVDHIDHVCQLAGNANHSGIGSDLDGGFGTEQCPGDLDTIADLQKLPALFRERGYAEDDIERIMHRNFLTLLERALPEA